MPRKGMTASGNRKQLPSRGENQANLGKMDKYPPSGPAMKVEPQVRFLLDNAPWDACKRDGGLNDYD
jgi:hypothetical protein